MDVPEMLPIMDSCIKKLVALPDADFSQLMFEPLVPVLFSEDESGAV